jgi:hypothetical protein
MIRRPFALFAAARPFRTTAATDRASGRGEVSGRTPRSRRSIAGPIAAAASACIASALASQSATATSILNLTFDQVGNDVVLTVQGELGSFVGVGDAGTAATWSARLLRDGVSAGSLTTGSVYSVRFEAFGAPAGLSFNASGSSGAAVASIPLLNWRPSGINFTPTSTTSGPDTQIVFSVDPSNYSFSSIGTVATDYNDARSKLTGASFNFTNTFANQTLKSLAIGVREISPGVFSDAESGVWHYDYNNGFASIVVTINANPTAIPGTGIAGLATIGLASVSRRRRR